MSGTPQRAGQLGARREPRVVMAAIEHGGGEPQPPRRRLAQPREGVGMLMRGWRAPLVNEVEGGLRGSVIPGQREALGPESHIPGLWSWIPGSPLRGAPE